MTTTPPVPLPTMHAPSGSDLDSWYEILLALTSPLPAYVPAIAGSVSNPTPSAATGTGLQLGKFITGRALITFSATIGSGSYFVTAPFATNEASGESAGSAHFFDASTGNRYPLAVFWVSSTTVSFSIPTGGRLTNVAPVTIAAGDQISIKWFYEGA